MPLDDQIYPAQVWTIQELEGSYTIVGRGANRVLEGYEDLLNLFICTAPNIRLKRVEEGYGVPAAQAEKLLDQNIFLIGFMGCGKSTVADFLNRELSMEVIEMDQIIAQRQGMSISDIFETYGEQYFRDLETNLLIEMQSRSNVVISCGGGTPMRECNVVEMKKNGRVVLLTAKPETILDRVKNNHDRPLIENNKTVPFIADLMEKRRAKYEAAADIIIETDGKNELEICEELVHRLRTMDEEK